MHRATIVLLHDAHISAHWGIQVGTQRAIHRYIHGKVKYGHVKLQAQIGEKNETLVSVGPRSICTFSHFRYIIANFEMAAPVGCNSR